MRKAFARHAGAGTGADVDTSARRHHAHLGVSSATGRMHSSGVTPPCRNEPRYRLRYKYNGDASVAGQFELAPPGEPESFKPYLTWTGRRR